MYNNIQYLQEDREVKILWTLLAPVILILEFFT